MKKTRFNKGFWMVAASAVALLSATGNASACAMCSGKSDSKLAQGMNWGIFSLLFVVVCVLIGVASVGIFFARKAAAYEAGRETVVAPGMMPATAKG